MATIPKDEIQKRIAALQSRMTNGETPLDGVIIVQNIDLYYFAGTVQTAHLLIPASGEPRLLVRKVLERAQADSPLTDIQDLRSMRQLQAHVEELCGPAPWRLGMELDVLPAASLAFYEKLLESASFTDASPAIMDLRAVKSDWELDQIRDAAALNDAVYKELPEVLKPGMSTINLQATLDAFMYRAGGLGLTRFRGLNLECNPGVIVSGPNGAIPGHSQFPIGGKGPHPAYPQGGDHDPIVVNTPIICDYLSNTTGYFCDQTRMAVLGEMPQEASRILDGTAQVIRHIESLLKPGAVPEAIYESAVAAAADAGIAEGFMGPTGYDAGFVGHGVGLEVNEYPILAPRMHQPLVAGNVLAVEPKVTHPQYGVIGLENTYVVTDSGPQRLSAAPEDVISVAA
ncbi:MAG: M24 family metallopeptidase [Lentisphaeria bacterium]